MRFELNGKHSPLVTIATAEVPAGRMLAGRQRHHRRLTQRPLLGGMLKRKTRQFMGFLGRNLLQDRSSPLPSI